MRQLHVDNHYVPQVYLRQWATNSTIPTCSLLVPHERVPLWKRHSLKGIAFHQHLYTQIVGGEESDEFERWLDCEFEAPAQRAIDRAITDQQMTADDWHALIRFAFAQDVRTPARLRDFLRRQNQELQSQLDKTLHQAVKKLNQDDLSVRPGEASSAGGLPLKLSVEEKPDGTGILRAETVIGRALWLWALRHLLTNTIAKISYKGWSIVRAAPGYSWPTSDSPLIRLNYFHAGRYDFNGGWGVPNGDVLLPLSPTHLLHRCAGKRPPDRGHQLDSVITEQVERIIIEHADRYVFAKEEFDINAFRERTVSSNLHATEMETWAHWPAEQAAAET